MGGFGHAMPGLATFFVIAGLTSLGLPGLSGFVAELLVFLGTWTSAHPWWLFPAVIGAFVTAIYILRAVNMIFLGPPGPHAGELRDARGVEWATLVVLGGLLVVLGIFPRLVLDTIHVGVAELLLRMGS
jgi:NADH-quinone oxidoreductase subunit M